MIVERKGEVLIGLSDFIQSKIEPCVMTLFNGEPVPVILKELNQAEILSCGDFSLIETARDIFNKRRKIPIDRMLAYAEIQDQIVRKAMVSPTYDQVVGMLKSKILIDNAESEIKEIKTEIESIPIGPKKDALKAKVAEIELSLLQILPVDFTSFVFSYALGIDKSDIKLITEDMLYDAAILASRGHDNPADHLSGIFSDFNRDDINRRAWIVYAERMKENGSAN